MYARVILLAAFTAFVTAVCWHPDDALPTTTWGYSLELGPLTWAGLPAARSWNVCRLGRTQSPVVVHKRWAPTVPTNKFRLTLTNASEGRMRLLNLGTTLEVPAEPIKPGNNALGGRLLYDSRMWVLQQMHFHTPSEHRIDDEYYPLEMHMVFNNTAGELLVVGILFDLDHHPPSPNYWLRTVFLNVNKIAVPGTRVPLRALNMAPLHDALKKGPLYYYSGSLTTPPCTEGVRWVVLGTPQPLDIDTYNAVKKVLKFNSRYSQNGPTKINLLEKARRIADGLDFQGIMVQDEQQANHIDDDESE